MLPKLEKTTNLVSNFRIKFLNESIKTNKLGM